MKLFKVISTLNWATDNKEKEMKVFGGMPQFIEELIPYSSRFLLQVVSVKNISKLKSKKVTLTLMLLMANFTNTK